MAIQEIKEYRQKDGIDILKVITKSTKLLPEGGYFYCDTENIDLVEKYNWYVEYKLFCVTYRTNDYFYRKHLLFHQELAYKYLGYYPDYIDHINGIAYDNTDINLNVVTNQQNAFNRPSRGYTYNSDYKYFQAYTKLNYKTLNPYSCVHSEVEACQLAHLVETDYLRNILKEDYYIYDFLKDRRNDLDILDLERTGVISEEEATYRHVIRYAKDNAWYYYRYNLEQYFKDNHIPVPDFSLDEQGFMRHPITNQLLCQF